jgi:hypothetical protein
MVFHKFCQNDNNIGGHSESLLLPLLCAVTAGFFLLGDVTAFLAGDVGAVFLPAGVDTAFCKLN